MNKNTHEIRDPVHGFIRYYGKEKGVINSRPFQRLRHIRQLAMSSYVYPGATHTRFEHSLGVMELLYQAGKLQWSEEKIRKCKAYKGPGTIDFPVMKEDRGLHTASAISMLPLLNTIPPAEAEFIFVEPEIAPQAERWFRENRASILSKGSL